MSVAPARIFMSVKLLELVAFVNSIKYLSSLFCPQLHSSARYFLYDSESMSPLSAFTSFTAIFTSHPLPSGSSCKRSGFSRMLFTSLITPLTGEYTSADVLTDSTPTQPLPLVTAAPDWGNSTKIISPSASDANFVIPRVPTYVRALVKSLNSVSYFVSLSVDFNPLVRLREVPESVHSNKRIGLTL